MSHSEDTPSRIRVLIVDPHEVSRAAIRALLQTEGADVVADVANAEQALAAGPLSSPDIAILDVGRGARNAPEIASALARLPSMPTVVLTSSTTSEGSLDGYAFIPKADLCARELRLAMRRPKSRQLGATMSMQAYLDNITAKTGKTPEELVALATTEGLLEPGVKAGQIVSWLKDEHGLGRGHAMAIVATIHKQAGPPSSTEDKVSKHFSGKRSSWRPVYDELIDTVSEFGPDTDVVAGASYLSLRKAGKKFAIVQVTADRLDIGIKLKGAPPNERLEDARSWNSMVTHRVRIHTGDELDRELVRWLERAYAAT